MIIESARQTLENANSYLAIGFGFRDQHIHTNLERKLKQQNRNKPFVVITKELTDETKNLFFHNAKPSNYLLIESYNENGTRIYKKERNSELEEFVLEDEILWSLDGFVNCFIGGQ